MIEVEEQFAITKKDEQRLLKGAEFLKEITMSDIYYDDDDYSLTCRGWWMRKRNDNYEIKMNKRKDLEGVDQHEEVEDEQKIREILSLRNTGTMDKALASEGYLPFMTITTTRKKYKKGEFSIDLDISKAEDFFHKVCEIELLVSDDADLEEAEKKIMDFASENKLPAGHARGKVISYLIKKRPEHFNALVKAGIIKPLKEGERKE